jgi:hypothetical protein
VLSEKWPLGWHTRVLLLYPAVATLDVHVPAYPYGVFRRPFGESLRTHLKQNSDSGVDRTKSGDRPTINLFSQPPQVLLMPIAGRRHQRVEHSDQTEFEFAAETKIQEASQGILESSENVLATLQ